jgi:hypothetical protein
MLASRVIAPSLAALGGAAILLAPSGARADGSRVAVSPALTLSVSFGQKVSFGLGLDLRVTGMLEGYTSGCHNGPRRGLGGFAQVTWLNFSAWRFAGGAHGGGEVYEQNVTADGEIGWTYRTKFGDAFPAYHGIHLGAVGAFTFGFPPSVELPVRVAIPLTSTVRTPEVTVGLGARFPHMYGFPIQCIEGRPLRTDDGIARPGVIAGRERRLRDARLGASTRRALADAWTEDARSESAAISAFVALARDLAAVGAPPSLVARALRAADDEVRHTLACAEIASSHAGFDIHPLLLDAPPAPLCGDRRDALVRMALESWLDGCLGEGAAAARAASASVVAADPVVRRAHAAIAVEERQHAELGWSALAWCLAAGGSEVSDAIAEAARAPEGDLPIGDPACDADPAATRDHGRLPQDEVDATWRRTLAASRHRAESLLPRRFPAQGLSA